MKTLLLLLSGLMLFACAREEEKPLLSPSKNYSVRTEIPGDSAGPERRLSVKLLVQDHATQQEMALQTGASSVHGWALAWSPSDRLVLYSSDIGTNAYEVKDGKIIERDPTPEEKEVGRAAYKQKYGE